MLGQISDTPTPTGTSLLIGLKTSARPSPYNARAPPMLATGLRLVSYPQLKLRGIPYSRSHLRRLEASGQFPPHVTLGEGLGALIAWPEHEVDGWIAEKMARRVPAGPAASISCP
jgi:prophage regulatory protein